MSRADFEVEIGADPKLLCGVRGLIRGYVDSLGFSEDQTGEIVLAVDEACSNSIRHSYGGPCDRTYWLTLRSTPEWLEIVIRDDGEPAPNDAVREKDLETPQNREEIAPGGLGVQLMYRVFDKVEFCPGEAQGNCVTLQLRRPRRDTQQA